jgi:4-amino-4-deoxy-L-arabinose transferase-like glycosyltransferase
MGALSRFKFYALPCLVLLCLTLPHLDQGDFRRDTGRYAAVGHYMWSSGELLVPHLNPQTPYFNKPPLALLIHGLFLKTFGVNVAVARIPSILAAMGIVLLTMLAVRQIGSRTEALATGFVLATTLEFFRRSREISLDLWQLFFVMGAVVLILRAIRLTKPWLLAVAGLPLGLALLCKPLVALLVIPIAALWCLKSSQRRFVAWLFLATFPVALLVATPWHWHMYSQFGDAFLNQYFGHEVLDRALGLQLKQPVYYYLQEGLRTYWPWLPVLCYALVQRFGRNAPARKPHRDLVVLGLLWVIPMFLLLSIFPDKKPNYQLPLFPVLSWIVAAGLCRLPWRSSRAWYELRLPWLAPSAAALLALLSVLPIQIQKGADTNWKLILDWMARNPSADAVFEAGLVHNEICYFYLKTGKWLSPWRAECEINNIVNPILVTRSIHAPDLSKNGYLHPAVSAGDYAILATSRAGP